MEEGADALPFQAELTLLEQGLPALEACDDNVHDKGAFLLMPAIFVQCLEIFEDDVQSGRQCSVASLVLLWSF